MPIGDLYDAGQIIDKTLIADRDVNVYDGFPSAGYQPKLMGTVKAGDPVGIVYSYIDADPSQNRPTLWWVLYPATSTSAYYYTPHVAGYFDISALRQQGVISVTEQAAAGQDAPWYEKVLGKALPAIVIAIVGAAVARGLLSRNNS